MSQCVIMRCVGQIFVECWKVIICLCLRTWLFDSCHLIVEQEMMWLGDENSSRGPQWAQTGWRPLEYFQNLQLFFIIHQKRVISLNLVETRQAFNLNIKQWERKTSDHLESLLKRSFRIIFWPKSFRLLNGVDPKRSVVLRSVKGEKESRRNGGRWQRIGG